LTDFIHLSQQLLLAAKMEQPHEAYAREMAASDEASLAAALPNDAARKAFWLNVYNAFTQLTLRNQPSLYQNRQHFYAIKQIEVAGKRLSLNDVEHGLLRRSRHMLSFGYFNHWPVGAFEKVHRVDRRDPRIHFALNCGAASCPPIRFYQPTRIDEQLDIATQSYLAEMTDYREGANEIWIPKLFLWFRGDFGGRKGILAMLRQYGQLPENAKPRIRYTMYDWSMQLNQFR
jgi:hypothetical protein